MRVPVLGMWVLSAIALSGCVAEDNKSTAKPSCESVMPAGFPTSPEGLGVGDTAPDLQMLDSNGNQLCTRDFAGKVVLINSAAGWCPPCQAETPGIQDVYEEFKGDGFVVIMAMLDDYANDGQITNEEFFDSWQEEYGITFDLIEDEGGAVYTTYVDPSDPNFGAIPANILINRDQVVSFAQIGSISEGNLRTRVSALVSQEPTLEY